MVTAMRLSATVMAAFLLGGCALFGGGGGVSKAPAPTPATQVSTALNGRYKLTQVSGEPLPSLRRTVDGCRIELDSGELDVYGAHFDLTDTTRRLCGDMVVARTLHHVSGSYQVDGQRLHFKVDHGSGFQSASGMLEGQVVRLLSLTHWDGRAEPVDWRFERQSKSPRQSGLGS